RHGRLWTDPGVGPRDLYEIYRQEPEAWLEQQNAKNKARALAEYEWRKPENAAARIAQARAAWQAQRAAQEEADRVFRARVAEEEAERKRQKEIEKAAKKAADEAHWAELKAARGARAERIEAERAAAAAWWSTIDPAYAREDYRPCRFGQTMYFGDVTLEPNQGYWLPLSVRGTLLKELGFG
ncbi:MAG TPA: hypothetical protein VJY85_10285, partial [Candidatus Limnocylindria bacterium]|nr:hypothetical protein [Candidatus Limnocylindria bacterium]